MTSQNSTEFHSTIEFLSKECKFKNHINCCKAWTGIGFQVICNCSCHNNNNNNNNSDDSDTIQDRGNINE
jgi:hypothetical protein